MKVDSVAPALIPAILLLHSSRQLSDDKPDTLYIFVALGTVLSSIFSYAQILTNKRIRSRRKLTLFTASLLTVAVIASTIGFNLLRINIGPNSYKLPVSVRDRHISAGKDVFRYHFFADFLPGLLIFSQIQFCFIIVNHLLCKAKRSFTKGEAFIVAQLASSLYLTWILTLYARHFDAGPFRINLTTDIILNIAIHVFGIAFLPGYLFVKPKLNYAKFALIASSLATSYYRARELINASPSELEPLTWLIDYIFSTHQRLSLFSLWLSTLTGCVSFSTSWSKMVGQTNSIVRKIFHLAICVVFISGYNQDLEFTRFAAGGILTIMFILEMIRAWQLEPLGHHLENVCRTLRGKWDNRYLTLSHIYLLVGTMLPLWLLPNDPKFSSKLALSCGLIAVGIGDTAAAVIGTFFGKTQLTLKSGKSGTSEKTLEGFLGNVAAMIAFKLIWVGYTDFIGEFSFIMAATLTALVEAMTSTCDNLLLPLVMLLLIEIF